MWNLSLLTSKFVLQLLYELHKTIAKVNINIHSINYTAYSRIPALLKKNVHLAVQRWVQMDSTYAESIYAQVKPLILIMTVV